MGTVGWGIIGAGRIAGTFATALRELPDARLVAIGSRTKDKAESFAAEHGAARAYGSYEGLIADPDVDVVYVATPHPLHHANTLACLAGGKAVLCEKPLAMDERQAREMVGSAVDRGLFLMEAMWTRCLPVIKRVGEWLDRGAIGDVRMVTARFGFRTEWNPEGRLLNPALGGGAILDVGVYTVAFAQYVYGRAPVDVSALAHIGETGVDEQTAMTLRYEDGSLAQLACAVRTSMHQGARIEGTKGSIDIPVFWKATSATLEVSGEDQVEFTGAAGYQFEAAEVMECLRNRQTESDRMPLKDSIDIASTMDRIRAGIGLRYPME